MNLNIFFNQKQKIINNKLELLLSECFSEAVEKQRLYLAMKHSLMSGGKRLRPILCIEAAGLSDNNSQDRYLFAACALEFIHTYTLIHDDLPALDNDDLRRGHTTCHKEFDEATAILAGDALLTESVRIISNGVIQNNIPPELGIKTITMLFKELGADALLKGQMLDILSENATADEDLLKTIHENKTAKLITASLLCGAILSGADKNTIDLLSQYGMAIGTVFQITDDILNIEGTEEETGKGNGTDIKNSKLTFPAVYGIAKSKLIAAKLTKEAVSSCEKLGKKAQTLKEIAIFLLNRKK